MRRALLISFEPAHFTELRRVARLLQASGRWDPVIYFAKSHADTPGKVEICRSQGWGVRVEPTALETPEAESQATQSRRSYVQSVLRPLPEPLKQPLRRARRFFNRYPTYKSILRAAAVRARAVLAEERTRLVVLPEDNLEHLTSVFVREASALGAPTVIVPFTVANALEPAEAYFGNPAYTLSGISGAMFARMYPQWVVRHRGQRLVRIPVMEALALQRMGYAPPQPWILNSGYAAAIAVESEAMMAHYRACALPEGQLVLTGALYDDELHAAGRRAADVRRSLGLDSRPMVLCALAPDDGIPFRRPGQCEFPDHVSLVRGWINALCSRKEFQTVVSLHPRTAREPLAFIETMGAKIAPMSVAEAIPACDLYVASGSATIRMAIACGKPVVNYDVYRYRYTDYVGVPGVIHLDSLPAFEAALEKLAREPVAFEALASAQQGVMAKWGVLDGHSGERMLALFERLTTAA